MDAIAEVDVTTFDVPARSRVHRGVLESLGRRCQGQICFGRLLRLDDVHPCDRGPDGLCRRGEIAARADEQDDEHCEDHTAN